MVFLDFILESLLMMLFLDTLRTSPKRLFDFISEFWIKSVISSKALFIDERKFGCFDYSYVLVFSCSFKFKGGISVID